MMFYNIYHRILIICMSLREPKLQIKSVEEKGTNSVVPDCILLSLFKYEPPTRYTSRPNTLWTFVSRVLFQTIFSYVLP